RKQNAEGRCGVKRKRTTFRERRPLDVSRWPAIMGGTPMPRRSARVLSGFGHELADVEVEGLGHAQAVVRIGAEEVADLAQLNLARNTGHVSGDVAAETLLLVRTQQAEEIAGLRVVVVALAMVVAIGVAGDLERRLVE